MRPISFSLIAVLSLACENTALDSTYIDSQLVDPLLFTLELEEQEDTMSGIPSLVLPGIELEAQEDEPKVPEWDNERAEPEVDEPEEELQQPEQLDGDLEVEATEMACGVYIVRPERLELQAGEKLTAKWQSPDDGQRSTYIGLVTDAGEEVKLLPIEEKQGTAHITLPDTLEPGIVRLFIGAEDTRQSWFCKDSSYVEILP